MAVDEDFWSITLHACINSEFQAHNFSFLGGLAGYEARIVHASNSSTDLHVIVVEATPINFWLNINL